MSNYLVQRLTAIELYPIRSLTLYVAPDFVTFTNVEAESSWSIRPVIRTDTKGASRTVAWKAEAKIYVPHLLTASFGDTEGATTTPLVRQMKDLSRLDSCDTQLILGNKTFLGFGDAGAPTPYNYTGGAMIDFGQCAFSFEMESAELRGRSIITISRTAKTVSQPTDAGIDYEADDIIYFTHYSGG